MKFVFIIVFVLNLHILLASAADYVTSQEHLKFAMNNLYLEKNNSKLLYWGYETESDFRFSYSYNRLQCYKYADRYPVDNLDERKHTFWKQADFGFIKERLDSYRVICEKGHSLPSYLGCSDHLEFCRAENILFDFRNLRADESNNKYREDVIGKGDVVGNCRLEKELLKSRTTYKSPLQSWAAELENFETSTDFHINALNCDIILNKPIFIIKLDAGISMYHHFCDFVNLYISQHVNGSFSRDIQILIWDTSGSPYADYFSEMWSVFTRYPLLYIKEFDGKRVCFRQIAFSLLARMRYGLYYNIPLIGGCEGSGLFHAFSKHVVHRLKVKQRKPPLNKIRVTFLSRSTKYRRIQNENELVNALKTIVEFEVKKVDYDRRLTFLEQLEISCNSDIFIGIHGSGLTHLLFLPDWAAVFEIYNCDDASCYYDLARLRGVKYFTWEAKHKVYPEDEGHHPTLGAHAKFTNYAFDVQEFIRMVAKAANYVQSHAEFQREQELARKRDLYKNDL